eukprot:353642-Chlamydomonas_euryale.AAC.1
MASDGKEANTQAAALHAQHKKAIGATKQASIDLYYGKSADAAADLAVAMFLYECGIAFNVTSWGLLHQYNNPGELIDKAEEAMREQMNCSAIQTTIPWSWVDESMVKEEEKDEEPAGTELDVFEVASSDEDDNSVKACSLQPYCPTVLPQRTVSFETVRIVPYRTERTVSYSRTVQPW